MMGPAAALESAIERLTMSYATQQSAAICSALIPVATTGITIYIMLTGFAVLRGAVHDTVNTLVWKALRIGFIAAIALGGGVYQNYVINGMTSLEGGFAQAITSGQGQSASSVGQELDQDIVPLNTLTDKLYAQANQGWIPDPHLLAAAVLCTLAQIIVYIAALAPLLVAKVTVALMLAIGPAFILMAIWPATQRFTEAWLAATLTAELTIVVIEFVVNFLPALLNAYASQVLSHMGSEGLVSEVVNVLSDSIGLFITAIVLAWIAWTSGELGARLANGASFGNPASTVARYAVERLAFRRGGGGGSTKNSISK